MTRTLSAPEDALASAGERPAAPEGWDDRRDRALLGLLFRREQALLRDDEGSRRQAAELEEELDRRLAERRRLFERLGPSSRYAPERLVLLVTHACQLRCSYCRVSKFSSSMSHETVDRGVDLLFTSRRPRIQLQFFGGDPLLRFDLIERAVLRAERLAGTARSIRFMLTTNGHALDARKLDFFKSRDFLIEYSFDGKRSTFLAQRPGVGGRDLYDRVLGNLQALRRSGARYYVIMVATPESVAGLFENFRYVAELGHRSIQINYQLGRFWPDRAVTELLRQMGLCAAHAARRPGLTFVNTTSIRREPTVLNSELVVDTDGGIYRETGICLEEDFQRQKRDFHVADVQRAGDLAGYPSSPFDNFHLLSSIYGRRRPELRRIILNNVLLGYTVDRWVRTRSGRGP